MPSHYTHGPDYLDKDKKKKKSVKKAKTKRKTGDLRSSDIGNFPEGWNANPEGTAGWNANPKKKKKKK